MNNCGLHTLDKKRQIFVGCAHSVSALGSFSLNVLFDSKWVKTNGRKTDYLEKPDLVWQRHYASGCTRFITCIWHGQDQTWHGYSFVPCVQLAKSVLAEREFYNDWYNDDLMF